MVRTTIYFTKNAGAFAPAVIFAILSAHDVVRVHRCVFSAAVKSSYKEFVFLVRVEIDRYAAALSCCADEFPVVRALFARHYLVSYGSRHAAPYQIVVAVALGVNAER
mgnify:CR=1 FL=1